MPAAAGAGLAAAFNAPLAGLTFVLEELQRHFAPAVFGAAFVAAVTADVLTRSLTSQLPVFHVASAPAPPLVALPVFLGLGLLAGVLGVAFNRSLLKTLELFARVRGWPASLSGVLVGAAVGLMGWFVPEALGGGQPLVEVVLKGHMPLPAIPWWFLLRFGLTTNSSGPMLGCRAGDSSRRGRPTRASSTIEWVSNASGKQCRRVTRRYVAAWPRRNARPGSAPVLVPCSMTTTPLTMT